MSRKNYTEREKSELLAIVEKFRHIIENKCTNAVTVQKKNETWLRISELYNASAEIPRTAKQLICAYQNLKRLTRQNVAAGNMQNYILQKKENLKVDDDINISLIKQLKKDDAADKKAIKATGGGSYQPQLSSSGAQILAMMADETRPLSNDYDSAAGYYEHTGENYNGNEVIIEVPAADFQNDVLEVSSAPRPPKKVKHLKNKKANKMSTDAIKRRYYMKKLECAVVEKKKAIMEYNISSIQYKIKQLEYNNLLKMQ